MVLGADWNASLAARQCRHGYSGLPHIQAADVWLAEWSAASGLTCATPAQATWMSIDESRKAVLDCFFWRSKTGQPCLEDTAALDAADPSLDHRVVKATLKVEGICAMLPLEAFIRPVRAVRLVDNSIIGQSEKLQNIIIIIIIMIIRA